METDSNLRRVERRKDPPVARVRTPTLLWKARHRLELSKEARNDKEAETYTILLNSWTKVSNQGTSLSKNNVSDSEKNTSYDVKLTDFFIPLSTPVFV